ncbi:MAG: Mov34/MPN/PAD-1 family protein [Vicinamibacterales bacterium]
MELKITRRVLDGVIAHARQEAPCECCGLLAGEGDLIDEYVRTRNIRPGEVAYEIDPREHISIRKALRARSRSVLGAYHSHPRTAAVPSATDLAEAHYDGDFVYLIVSLEREPPDVRVYRLERDALIETRFETPG